MTGIKPTNWTYLEREFNQAWIGVERSFAHAIIELNYVSLKQVYQLMTRSQQPNYFDYRLQLRAGASLYTCTLSRSKSFILRPEQPRITINDQFPEAGFVVRYFNGIETQVSILPDLVEGPHDITPTVLSIFDQLLEHTID